MSEKIDQGRRSMFRGLPLAAVAASLPALAADHEIDTDKVERLAHELSAAIANTYGGQFRVVVRSGDEISYEWA